jgi:hypothetical protein
MAQERLFPRLELNNEVIDAQQAAQPFRVLRQNGHSFLSFPYVCPEPVLVK